MPLQVRDLSFSYVESRPILSEISFSLESGEIVGLMGNIGSGKSTLIRHLNGLLSLDDGVVLVNGLRASDRKSRKKVGLLFQHPSRQLFGRTVFDDIAFGPKNYGSKGKDLDTKVYGAANLAGLRKELLASSPQELSGGEKKLACFAGVIACSPDYVIMDEPFSGIDSKSRGRMVNAIRNLRSAGCGVLIASHNPNAFAGIVDRMLYLENGKIVFDGAPWRFASLYPHNSPVIPALMAKLEMEGLDVSTSVVSAQEAFEEILFACGRGGKS